MKNTPLSFSLSQKTVFSNPVLWRFVLHCTILKFLFNSIDKNRSRGTRSRSVACTQSCLQDLCHESHAHVQHWAATMFIHNNKSVHRVKITRDSRSLQHLWVPRHVCNGLIICPIVSQWYKAPYDDIIGGLIEFFWHEMMLFKMRKMLHSLFTQRFISSRPPKSWTLQWRASADFQTMWSPVSLVRWSVLGDFGTHRVCSIFFRNPSC